MALEQTGNGGVIKYGFRTIANVGAWTYRPVEDGKGAGTIDAVLIDDHAAYAHKTDVAIELTKKNGTTLVWATAERFGDCLIVNEAPVTRKPTATPAARR